MVFSVTDTVEKCEGCGHVHNLAPAVNKCDIYAYPAAKQRVLGGCASQTNRQSVVKVPEKKVNALKASKRAAQGK